MIRHCVFVRFKRNVPEEERAAIFEAIEALRAVVPGILRVDAGRNASPERLDKGFSNGFVVDFMDAEARDRYLANPDHAKVGARIVAAAEDGIDGVMVFDLEL